MRPAEETGLNAVSGRLGALLAVLLLICVAPAMLGDIFHLEGGGRLEGTLEQEIDGNYRIRTTVGIVTVPASSVERIEEAETPLDEYERLRDQTAGTPEAQVQLAEWCAEQGLRGQRRQHLRRAIELDPNCEPARLALGYVRVGELWVDGRKVTQREEKAAAAAEAEDPEKLARAIQAQWYRRIRAIKSSLLDASLERLVRDGQRKIREIRDPLAILPLTKVLSEGSVACRQLLVEVLRGFPQDESTMNLALLALLDPNEAVRHGALAELRRREDPRVIPNYREGVRNGNDLILRRSAIALGELGAAEAVPDLIDRLTARRNRWVEVPVKQYVRRLPRLFNGQTIVSLGGSDLRVAHTPQVGLWRIADQVENEWQYRQVTVYRTEVLEALKKLTGQNFGFEHEAWRRWYKEHTQ